MSVGVSAGLIAAGVGAAGSIGSALIGSHAASTAANQQTQAEQQALDFQKQVYGNQTANEQPFVSAGGTSIGQIMGQLQNGTAGIGSLPQFQAPTAAQAAATPGYQFTFDQGMRGVNASAAAHGGALSGGAIKAAAQYGTGLADSTYNDVFNRSLAGYQQNMAAQAQGFNQELGTAQLGQQGIAALGNVGTGAATNVGNIMSQIGSAQAGGTLGSAQALGNGIAGVGNAVSQGLVLSRVPGMFSTPGYSPAIGNGGAPIPLTDGTLGAYGEIPA